MFPEQLRKLRAGKNISQKQLAEMIGFSQQSIGKWETGVASPSPDVLVKLAELFQVSTDYLLIGIDNLPPTLRGDEKRLLRLYNQLNGSGRRLAMINLYKRRDWEKEDTEWWETHQDAVARLMEESFGPDWRNIPPSQGQGGQSWKDEESYDFEQDRTPYPVSRNITVYRQPASAGTGTFLDSDDYDLMDIPFDKIPLQTTFGLCISGDSMTPDYFNNDILFIKQQPTIEDGELGIFILNGDAYFKRLSNKGKKISLQSLNSDYEPINLSDHDELRVVGKVIGRYNEHQETLYKQIKDIPRILDERQREIDEGIHSDADWDNVYPTDPEYDMNVPWASSDGKQLDKGSNNKVQKGLRLFEKRARLAAEANKLDPIVRPAKKKKE